MEQNHVRFLGDLILNLWDCGGQDSFMDSYLTTQRSTIFQSVGVMIYVFDVESHETTKDLKYYRDCLDGLRYHSPEAAIFILIHKMDLVREPQQILDKRRQELEEASGDVPISLFGTTIFDQTLYKVHLHNMVVSLTIFADCFRSPGLVKYSPHPHSKCQHPLQAPCHLRSGLWCNRSHPLRAHNVPRHCYLILWHWRRLFSSTNLRQRRFRSQTRTYTLRTYFRTHQIIQVYMFSCP